MNEEWRDIQGYEGLYQVSNLGRVKSLSQEICITEKSGRTYKYTKAECIRTPGICKGYCNIPLTLNGKRTTHYVHRLVATAFIPNPQNLPEINHKDRNPLNNDVKNLEWCTRYYNTHYDNAIERQHATISKGVRQKRLDGTVVAEYQSICEASRQTGFCKSSIARVANGQFCQSRGFIWEYINR